MECRKISLYDDLRAAFTLWYDDAMNVRNAWARIPAILAKEIQIFLGAPEQFSEAGFEDKTKHYRYVSPAVASWNPAKASFDLRLKEGGLIFNDFELHPTDGRFYFGLAIFLERSSNSYPKEPFWFLCSLGYKNKEYSLLRVQRMPDLFSIPHATPKADGALTPVCEVIGRLLLEDLSISPFARTGESTMT